MRAYKGNIIYTPSPDAFSTLENGYILVDDGGRVVEVTPTLPNNLKCEIVDFTDHLIIPAFNDLHLHAPQYRNMGFALDEELLPWLEKYTFPEEAKYKDTAYAERMYRRFVHELWMQGTMRCSLFASIHYPATRLLALMFKKAGMGAYIGLVGMDRNCPEYLRNTTAEVVENTARLDDELGHEGLVRAIVTPRFVPACSPDMLGALGQLAAERNIPVQSHLSENHNEIAWVRELEPSASCYADAYHRYGLLGTQPTLMAHCCHTRGAELALLRQQNVMVVHCPTSNSNLASGVAPVRSFLELGVPVALGTDISGGHYASVLRVIQYAIQFSKIHSAYAQDGAKPLLLSEAFYMATKSGGSFFGQVGSFEPGYEFDALVIDDSYLNYDHYTLDQRLERYIYLGDDRDIRHRYCRGTEIQDPGL